MTCFHTKKEKKRLNYKSFFKLKNKEEEAREIYLSPIDARSSARSKSASNIAIRRAIYKYQKTFYAFESFNIKFIEKHIFSSSFKIKHAVKLKKQKA